MKNNGVAPANNGDAKLVTATAGYVNNNSPKKSALKNGKEPGKLSPSRTLSFTMRREHEKAKEEALLIAQLRQVLHIIDYMCIHEYVKPSAEQSESNLYDFPTESESFCN